MKTFELSLTIPIYLETRLLHSALQGVTELPKAVNLGWSVLVPGAGQIFLLNVVKKLRDEVAEQAASDPCHS